MRTAPFPCLGVNTHDTFVIEFRGSDNTRNNLITISCGDSLSMAVAIDLIRLRYLAENC